MIQTTMVDTIQPNVREATRQEIIGMLVSAESELKEVKERIAVLEQEKANLANANSENAAKYSEAKTEIERLKKASSVEAIRDYNKIKVELDTLKKAEDVRLGQLHRAMELASGMLNIKSKQLEIAKYNLENEIRTFNELHKEVYDVVN